MKRKLGISWELTLQAVEGLSRHRGTCWRPRFGAALNPRELEELELVRQSSRRARQ